MPRVIAYRNLRRGDWSIATLIGSHRRGKVISHASSLVLANATMHVEESGRLRVCKNRCREVHAWIIGDMVDSVPAEIARVAITYQPYEAGTFTRRDDGAPICSASFVEFTPSHGAIACGELS